MTPQEVETEIRAAGCGWDQPSGRIVLAELETPGYCNPLYCQSLAEAGTAFGSTPAEVGQAVRAYVDGDETALRVILAP